MQPTTICPLYYFPLSCFCYCFCYCLCYCDHFFSLHLLPYLPPLLLQTVLLSLCDAPTVYSYSCPSPPPAPPYLPLLLPPASSTTAASRCTQQLPPHFPPPSTFVFIIIVTISFCWFFFNDQLIRAPKGQGSHGTTHLQGHTAICQRFLSISCQVIQDFAQTCCHLNICQCNTVFLSHAFLDFELGGPKMSTTLLSIIKKSIFPQFMLDTWIFLQSYVWCCQLAVN